MKKVTWLCALIFSACQTPEPTPAAPPASLPSPAVTNAAVAEPELPAEPTAQPTANPDTQPPPQAPKDDCGDVPPGMACVPGATFRRGIDDDPHACDQDHQPADRRSASVPSAEVSVDTFYMDLTEVTVEAYTACVAAGKCPDSGPVYADFRGPRQPITGVPWYDANAYCVWAGKRLPTEAEWELAARGPDAETFPWGNAPIDCDRAVIMDDRGRSCGEIKRRGKNPEKGRVLDVGSRPAGRYGLFDMAGNAEEWVADWWTPTYADCGDACLGHNPKGPCDGAEPCPGMTFRAVRGGSWYWPGDHATGYHRRRHIPTNKPFHHFGFRCAKSLTP